MQLLHRENDVNFLVLMNVGRLQVYSAAVGCLTSRLEALGLIPLLQRTLGKAMIFCDKYI